MKQLWIMTISFTMMLTIYLMSSDQVVKGEQVSYSVNALLPENQLDRGHSYFDLRVMPNDEQYLQTEIMNHEQEEITVNMSVRNASTNANGIIAYEETEAKEDNDIIHLTDIVTFEEDEIVIPSGESKTVTAKLEMPADKFEGVILGGLHF